MFTTEQNGFNNGNVLESLAQQYPQNSVPYQKQYEESYKVDQILKLRSYLLIIIHLIYIIMTITKRIMEVITHLLPNFHISSTMRTKKILREYSLVAKK